MRPCGHLQRLPVAESLQAELKQPVRLILLGRDDTDGLLIQTAMDHLRIYISNKTILIVAARYLIYYLIRIFHIHLYILYILPDNKPSRYLLFSPKQFIEVNSWNNLFNRVIIMGFHLSLTRDQHGSPIYAFECIQYKTDKS